MEPTVFIQWKPSYSVGHSLIDRQHRIVIEVINELYLARRHGYPPGKLAALLKRLDQYTKAHLSFEERLLLENGYPDLPAHLELHRVMKARMAGLAWMGEAMDEEAAQELFDFLKAWWLHHILEEDMKYSEYLRQK
ncbi:bacteriohemerythrin [Geoalkalibacter halelectricus]|uniref:bacteriohemerythrin n=1 Tax=Geoalkalibacter halelectricus TaxID=2847045 RepID=UPI003D2051D7